ncbi:hypothetical protein Btru_043302 [Bulinus truncatus]|nr:hypothetical protein Btru_043302 [Bulinus truncatus]
MQNRGFSPAERYSLNFKDVRGRGRKRDDVNNAQQACPQSSDSKDDYNSSRGKHPPGLRGKEIGLWYARKNRAQQEKQRSTNTSSLFMDGRREENIRQLLSSLQKGAEFSPGASETCYVPVRSNSSTSSLQLEEDHEDQRFSNKFRPDVETTDIKDEPPDSWDMESNDSDTIDNTGKKYLITKYC